MAEEEKLASLAEVKNLLSTDEKERELTYEKRLALEHAKQFTVLNITQTNKLISQLIKLERVSDQLAYKIAELLPQHPEEVRPILTVASFSRPKCVEMYSLYMAFSVPLMTMLMLYPREGTNSAILKVRISELSRENT